MLSFLLGANWSSQLAEYRLRTLMYVDPIVSVRSRALGGMRRASYAESHFPSQNLHPPVLLPNHKYPRPTNVRARPHGAHRTAASGLLVCAHSDNRTLLCKSITTCISPLLLILYLINYRIELLILVHYLCVHLLPQLELLFTKMISVI